MTTKSFSCKIKNKTIQIQQSMCHSPHKEITCLYVSKLKEGREEGRKDRQRISNYSEYLHFCVLNL